MNEVIQLGPSADDFNEANKQHAVNYGAILCLLLEKGVFTQEEYDRTVVQLTADADQIFAQKRDQKGST